MNEERLKEIEQRHAACPPGEWYIAEGDDNNCMNARWVTLDPDPEFMIAHTDTSRTVAITLIQSPPLCYADVAQGDPVATFIAHAHNRDIPDLIEEVRRLRRGVYSISQMGCLRGYVASRVDEVVTSILFPDPPKEAPTCAAS